MRIAQITDSHLTAPGTLWKDRVDMAAALVRAVARLNEIGPDLVIHTGDIVDGGGEAQYGLAAEILSDLRAPIRLLPGNHDIRARMRAAFKGLPAGDWLNFEEEAEGLRLIGLDTVDEGRTAGLFDAPRAAWLGGALKPVPTLMFAHHPPCAMGLPFMDRFEFAGTELFARTLAAAPPLRIATGHVHAAAERHFAGTLVVACPAVGVQIPPIRAAGSPPSFALEPAMIRLHDWDATLGLTVKTVPIDAFPGPYPFETDPNADFNATPRT